MNIKQQLTTAARCLALATTFVALIPNAPAAAKDEAPSAAAAPAVRLHTLVLPKLADESHARLVLTAGKSIETDGVNRYFIGGGFESATRDGKAVWLVRTGPAASTRMGVPPGHPKGRQVVSVSSSLLPYAGGQALLIEAPADLKLSYQVWNAKGTEVYDPAAEAAAIKQAGGNIKAYKPAAAGTLRHVITLPKLEDNQAAKLEIVAGKTLVLGGKAECSFGGEIVESNIEGWGFTRIDVTLGELNGAQPDPQGETRKFVTLGAEAKFFRYNSRLPLVVYAPQGVEIRYRVWQPGASVAVDQDV